MNVLDEFKNYKRKFIQISHRTAILMHIFEKADDDFEDMILSDHHELKQDITKYYNLLQEYKTTYNNFILGLENESNSNQ
jgi:hypothetical protein